MQIHNGYHIIKLRKRRVFIHHLVLETFVGVRPSPYHICRHLNDVRDDNRLENLCWDIQRLNIQDIQTNTDKRKAIVIKMKFDGYSDDDICLLSNIPLAIIKQIA